MTTEFHLAKIGAVSAVVGTVTLAVGTAMHPMGADPNDLPAAFAEYAADPVWVASHLAQVIGLTLVAVGLLALAACTEAGAPAATAQVARALTVVSVALAGVLQAVDGIALKVMVDRWVDAGAATGHPSFDAAVAVRQIEVGVASLLALVFGLAIAAFGVAMIQSRRFSTWLGGLGAIAGLGTAAAGIAAAYDGFSDLNMTLTSVTGPLASLWAIGVGVSLWRLAPRLEDAGRADPA